MCYKGAHTKNLHFMFTIKSLRYKLETKKNYVVMQCSIMKEELANFQYSDIQVISTYS